MIFSRLPEELLRIIYDYDDTYFIFYKECINELKFLQKAFPIKLHMILYDNQEIRINTYIPLSKINKLNKFIFDYCKRKKSLRNYKSYKYFT